MLKGQCRTNTSDAISRNRFLLVRQVWANIEDPIGDFRCLVRVALGARDRSYLKVSSPIPKRS